MLCLIYIKKNIKEKKQNMISKIILFCLAKIFVVINILDYFN